VFTDLKAISDKFGVEKAKDLAKVVGVLDYHDVRKKYNNNESIKFKFEGNEVEFKPKVDFLFYSLKHE